MNNNIDYRTILLEPISKTNTSYKKVIKLPKKIPTSVSTHFQKKVYNHYFNAIKIYEDLLRNNVSQEMLDFPKSVFNLYEQIIKNNLFFDVVSDLAVKEIIYKERYLTYSKLLKIKKSTSILDLFHISSYLKDLKLINGKNNYLLINNKSLKINNISIHIKNILNTNMSKTSVLIACIQRLVFLNYDMSKKNLNHLIDNTYKLIIPLTKKYDLDFMTQLLYNKIFTIIKKDTTNKINLDIKSYFKNNENIIKLEIENLNNTLKEDYSIKVEPIERNLSIFLNNNYDNLLSNKNLDYIKDHNTLNAFDYTPNVIVDVKANSNESFDNFVKLMNLKSSYNLINIENITSNTKFLNYISKDNIEYQFLLHK